MNYWLYVFLAIALTLPARAQQTSTGNFVRDNYQKFEYKISMRDGTKLHTAVYVPKDASATNKYPFM